MVYLVTKYYKYYKYYKCYKYTRFTAGIIVLFADSD